MNHTHTCSVERNCVWRTAEFLRSKGSRLTPWNLCVGMVDGEPCARRATVAVGRFEDHDGIAHEGHPFCSEHARLIAASFAQERRIAEQKAKDARGYDYEGTIYFGVAGDRVKVGFSKNAYKRRRQIETGAGVRFDHFQWMVGDRSDERRLLNQFAEHRLIGEWFKADPTVLAALEREFKKRAA